MDSAKYWKIRALATALQLDRERTQAIIKAAEDRLQAALTAAGLDPLARYQFDDETESLRPTPVPATLPQE